MHPKKHVVLHPTEPGNPPPLAHAKPRVSPFLLGEKHHVPERRDLVPSLPDVLSEAPLRMDAGTHAKMRRGKLAPEARIDLHGMTLAELARMAIVERARAPERGLAILECSGWRRHMMLPATGLPWVLPSPNMPTFETAQVYPGQCLLEGTNLSEGRGCTRPFEIFGAPWLDGHALAAALAAEPLATPGLRVRPLGFKPMFHKFAGQRCGGVQLHVRDPAAVRSLQTSWALLTAMWRLGQGAMRWRSEPYEFVADRPAIDLLAGGPWLRAAVNPQQP